MTDQWDAGRLDSDLEGVGFDTLAVRVYQYASDERVGAALVPALLILLLGLAAALALVPGLERRAGRS